MNDFFFFTSEEILLDSVWLRELLPSLRLFKNEVANPQGRTSADTAWPQSSDFLQLETELSSSHGIAGTRVIHPQKRQRSPAQLSRVSKNVQGWVWFLLRPAKCQCHPHNTRGENLVVATLGTLICRKSQHIQKFWALIPPLCSSMICLKSRP